MTRALVAVLASGCAVTQPSQMIVVIDTDLVTGAQITDIGLEVHRGSEARLGEYTQLVDPGYALAIAPPLTVNLRSREIPDREIEVIAAGYQTDLEVHQRVVAQHVQVRFVPHTTRVTCLFLGADCVHVDCSDTTTCFHGACVPRAWMTLDADPDAAVARCDQLERTPRDGGLDAGSIDSGPLDGGDGGRADAGRRDGG